MIEGISGALFREMQGKAEVSSAAASAGGAEFAESLADVAALHAQIVARGGQISSAGLSERKMVSDFSAGVKNEEDETLETLFKKLTRLDELLKERFGG